MKETEKMPKLYKFKNNKINTKEMEGIILKGYVINKIIKKEGNSSGVIRVPKRFIGQRFRVILIPEDNVLDLNLK